MSALTEFEPVYDIPERARRCDDRPDATILQLHRPSERAIAAPVRLTRRGVVVLGLAVAMLCVALLGIAKLSAPSPVHVATSPIPATVTVLSGDTLWSIAERIAPRTDPRAEVVHLQELNHLSSVSLVPGQLIHTR
jgi:hypothetical protein